MEEMEFVESLLAFAGEEGVPLLAPQAKKCFEHLRLMIEWNRSLNLTRITEPGEILIKHFLDSLIPARWLPRDGPALDVGTGPGFPGIPLKILHPGLRMVLLEGHRKKVSFLRVVLSRLALEDIDAVQARLEDFPPAHHAIAPLRYTLVTLRAVRLENMHLVLCGSKLIEPGGVLAWWAGPTADFRVDSFSRAADEAGLLFDGLHTYSLPRIAAPRRLLVWKKSK